MSAHRLQYSIKGFERAVMMARVSLVAVVEGVDDNLFYDLLIQQYSENRGRQDTWQIRTPREVSANADGKTALVKIFSHFRSAGKLRSSSGSKRTIFFADLDYDGLSRRRLRNAHLIYTPAVSFENCLYELGNIRQSVETIISRRIEVDHFSPAECVQTWKLKCANAWLDWIIYCVACEISQVAPRKNRSGVSGIHRDFPPILKNGEPATIKSSFVGSVGNEEQGLAYWNRATGIVRNRLSVENIDEVLCGKWLPHFLRGEVQLLGGRFSALASRVNEGRVLVGHLTRDLRFTGRVRDYYYEALDRAFG